MADTGFTLGRQQPGSDTPRFEVYALRYATVGKRASENFIGGDPHDGPMPMDYFVWVAIGEPGTFVIDSGFTPATAKERGRTFLHDPAVALRGLNVDAASVSQVILTHLHYDHAGNLGLFPNATFHLQDAEMRFATGRAMRHHALRHSYALEDVVSTVRALYVGRVKFHDGDRDLCPGISLHHVGGHTGGLQVVRIATRAGWLVLASDATHYYANMNEGRPFPVVSDVAAMLEGHERLHELASAPELIVPGHDPLVMQRFQPVSGLEDVAVRLD